eukprot:SAG31_NODE_2720_length_5190_cov_3.678256_6_plen_165_part_00
MARYNMVAQRQIGSTASIAMHSIRSITSVRFLSRTTARSPMWQDQWSLSLFLRMVHHGMKPQRAIDFPSFSSDHFPSSFGGRAYPLSLSLEGRAPVKTADALRELGHKLSYKHTTQWGASTWGEGSLNCVGVEPVNSGSVTPKRQLTVFGAANARGSKNYAVGR